jgi:hypothetical protein
MVRNERRGHVAVNPAGTEVTLDGEPVTAPPVREPAFSGRYLLG